MPFTYDFEWVCDERGPRNYFAKRQWEKAEDAVDEGLKKMRTKLTIYGGVGLGFSVRWEDPPPPPDPCETCGGLH